MGTAVVANGRTYKPDELSGRWARSAIFGEPQDAAGSFDLSTMFAGSDTPPLPEVLAATGAAGWQAEGLVRLYAVEEVAHQRGGRFGRLAVGPATAVGVRIDGEFRTDAPGVASSAVP